MTTGEADEEVRATLEVPCLMNIKKKNNRQQTATVTEN